MRPLPPSNIITVSCMAFFVSIFLHSATDVRAEDQQMKDLLQKAQKSYKESLFAETELACMEMMRVNPDFFPAYGIMGKVYAQQDGLEQKAISYFDKSLQLNPKQADTYNDIAFVLNRIDKSDDAITYLTQGLKYEPDNFDLNFSLAVTYLMKKHDVYKALSFLKKAQNARPGYDKVTYLIGIAHFIAGDNALALETVTELRKQKNEYLALRLEEYMRATKRVQPPEPPVEVIKSPVVTKTEAIKSAVVPKDDTSTRKKTSVSCGNPEIKLKTKGVLTVKTEFRNNENTKAEEDPAK